MAKTKSLEAIKQPINKQEETKMETQQSAGKLKFKDLDGGAEGIKFVSLNKLSVGDIAAQGEYIGEVQNPLTKKTDFKFEDVDDNGNKTGSTTIVNGAGNLGFRMKSVSLGSIVQVVYEGKSAMTKGPFKGTMTHNVKILGGEIED
jgi:hypothetical protein